MSRADFARPFAPLRWRSVGAEPDDDATSVCESKNLWLYRVSEHGWLVRSDLSEAGPGPVIGCIDEHGGIFELMEVAGGFHWTTFTSLRDAVNFVANPTPSPGDERRFDGLTDLIDDIMLSLEVPT